MTDVPWISLFVIGVLWISHFHNCPLDISLIDIQWISFVYRCPMDVSRTIGAPWVSLSLILGVPCISLILSVPWIYLLLQEFYGSLKMRVILISLFYIRWPKDISLIIAVKRISLF